MCVWIPFTEALEITRKNAASFNPPTRPKSIIPHHPVKHRMPWTKNDELKLQQAVKRYGIGNWRKILENCNFDNKRTNVDIKDKWRNMNKAGGAKPTWYDNVFSTKSHCVLQHSMHTHTCILVMIHTLFYSMQATCCDIHVQLLTFIESRPESGSQSDVDLLFAKPSNTNIPSRVLSK